MRIWQDLGPCQGMAGATTGATYRMSERDIDQQLVSRAQRGDKRAFDFLVNKYQRRLARLLSRFIRDPAEIEDALLSHPAVAFVGAIGQPDAHAGELPCAYVELVAGASVTVEELAEHARANIHERAAVPKHIEILSELPKTAVGKIFKPDLRKMAIRRVYDEALGGAGLAAEVSEVVDDKKRGLVARLVRKGPVDEAAVAACLGRFTRPWEWA